MLFPGWLVHSVLNATGPLSPPGTYRVSLSFNLKGEWQDTGALHWRSGGRANSNAACAGV